MTDVVGENLEQRVLVLAPTGKDAALAQSILARAAIASFCCPNLEAICEQLKPGAGAIMVAEEAIGPGHDRCLEEWLSQQPVWSDLPILVLARPGADSAAVAQSMELFGNVTVLERPTRVAALVSAVRTALRGRERQYEARAHLSQIERSEGDLRDFFENASVGLHWVGPDGIVLRVNQTELDMFGYARDEYIGHHISEFHTDPAVITDILTRLSRGETVRDYEAQIRRKGGSIRNVLISSNVLWQDGKFIHTRSFTRDVTDLKRAQRAQAHLAAIVASSDDVIISKTLEGIILTWNAAAERLFGYSAAEAVGQPITLLIPPERRDEEWTILEHLRRGEHIDHFETVRVAKNGERIEISLTISPIRTADGRIIGASKIARDIRARKLAEARLRQSEAEARRLLELNQTIMANMAEGLFTVDIQGCVTYMNPEAEELLGWKMEELLGRSMHDATHYKHLDGTPFPKEECAGFQVLKQGETLKNFEDTFIHKDGSFFPVSYSSSPLRSQDGSIVGLVVAFQDISARKRAEHALREADRRKDEFLAVLAHELRNPLAPIRNSLHILRLTAQQDPAAERVGEMMERQVNHMVRLVDDLMEVSRITRGKIELRKEPVEVAAIVRSAVETSRPLIESAGHQLALTIPPEPLTLNGDPVRLTQVVANLLNNAARYTDAGGQIWLNVRRQGGEVVISVRDTGIGISTSMLPRVFELFTQIDRSANRGQGGLGIGLTLVKSLVEMHEGSVQAYSEGLGSGSEFTVRLPLAATQMDADASPSSAPASGVLAARRVLIVDDNQDAADSLAMLLKLIGADVQVVYSGPEAVEAFLNYSPTVVLLDIGMPGMDGYEVARRIRQESHSQNVTLIALTGWGQEEYRKRSKDAGFDYHLIKPPEFSALQTLIMSLEDRPRGP